MPFFMAGDQHISVAVQCVEVASVAISIFFSGEQAEQWEVGYIFPATELLSLALKELILRLCCDDSHFKFAILVQNHQF